MIDLHDLHLTFNPGTPLATPALRGITLRIPAGQFVTVVGSNGAGKSTLLNVLSGEAQVERGQVWIEGRNVTGLSVAARATWVARVFQNPLRGSCADLSVAENLALAAQRGQRRHLRWALTPRRCHPFRDRLATLGLGLEDRLDDRLGLLSGGQRQAICLLMATLAPHRILLLDEHTAALDPKTASLILALTQQMIQDQHLTTLMVTHSLSHALSYGDRTLVLHQGRIHRDLSGPDRSTLTPSQLLDAFETEEPDRNFS